MADWYALRSIDHRIWGKRSPWAGRLCRVVCEGVGPGPHNVLVELDGQRLVTIRRDKSLRQLRKGERQAGLFGG